MFPSALKTFFFLGVCSIDRAKAVMRVIKEAVSFDTLQSQKEAYAFPFPFLIFPGQFFGLKWLKIVNTL